MLMKNEDKKVNLYAGHDHVWRMTYIRTMQHPLFCASFLLKTAKFGMGTRTKKGNREKIEAIWC